MQPLDLMAWIDEHRQQLAPPVGNARIFEDGDFIIMAVGGPNRRQDFHVDPGDELFFQVHGDVVLEVIDDQGRRAIPVREGQMFLLPAGVPHSPQRPADTVGIVVERRRRRGEMDALRWYCEACGARVHEHIFELHDITTQLRDALGAWAADAALRTCAACGHQTIVQTS